MNTKTIAGERIGRTTYLREKLNGQTCRNVIAVPDECALEVISMLLPRLRDQELLHLKGLIETCLDVDSSLASKRIEGGENDG